MKLLGKGNHGFASLMADGRVQKCTNDKREYDAACLLVGKDIQGVAKVYHCSQYFDEEGNTRFLLVEERLQMTTKGIGMKSKKRFMKCFKLSWCDYLISSDGCWLICSLENANGSDNYILML